MIEKGGKHMEGKCDEGVWRTYDDRIDSLMEKPYWIVDMLPKQVPPRSGGQYFRVEDYIVNDDGRKHTLYTKLANVLVKLNCYVDIEVRCAEERWETNPSPAFLYDLFLFEGETPRSIYILFADSESLMVLHDEDTNMTVYNPRPDLLELLRALAGSEGLFVWSPSVE